MAAGKLRRAATSAAAAFQFLTRIPVPLNVPFDERTLARSTVFYPLAGAAIGLAVVGLGALLHPWLSPLTLAVLLLALWIALSGGLHLDGWLDTADGVLSHRSRERMLAIMKDSRVGAMGVIAGVLLLLLKVSLLADAAAAAPGGRELALLVSVPVWSRWWMTAAIAGWPYARAGEGIGALFRAVKARHAIAAGLVAVLLTAAALLAFGAGPQALLLLPACPAAAALAGWPMAALLHRRLGGLTGDTYGAMNEAVEAALLLVFVLLV